LGAGATNRVAKEVTGLGEFIIFAVKVVIDPEVRKALGEQWNKLEKWVDENEDGIPEAVVDKGIEIVKKGIKKKSDNYDKGGVDAEYQAGNDIVELLLIFYEWRKLLTKPGTKTLKNAKEALEAMNKIAEKIGNFMTRKAKPGLRDKLADLMLKQGANKMDDLGAEFGNRMKRLVDDLDSPDNKKLLDAMNENPTLVDSWKKLDELGVDDAIRKSPLHVGATKKLDDLKLDPNPSEANKFIKKINEGLAQTGDNGKHVAEKIKDGAYEGVEGYKDLVKQVKKSNDANPSLNNPVIPVKQAMDKFDRFTNEPKGNKFFEKGGKNPDGTFYDVDFGVKDASGNITIGYQLKKANSVGGIQKALKIENINQIKKAPDVADRRFEVELLSGSHNDILNHTHTMNKINSVKNAHPEIKFFIKVGSDIRQY
jgi:arsenate reductase-like glutaredoxin family protein